MTLNPLTVFSQVLGTVRRLPREPCVTVLGFKSQLPLLSQTVRVKQVDLFV